MKIKMKSSIKKISALLTMMAVAILTFTAHPINQGENSLIL